MPNVRCLCPDFPEIAFDRPSFVLESAFAESITVGIAPCFHRSERRCFVLCSKQTRKMQLMTACAEFDFCDFLGIRHWGRERIQFPGAAFSCPRYDHGDSPSPYLILFGLSSAFSGEAETQQTAGSFLMWPWLTECVWSVSLLLCWVRLDSRQKNQSIWVYYLEDCHNVSRVQPVQTFALQGQMHQKGSHWFLSCVTLLWQSVHRSGGSWSKREAAVLFEKDPSLHPWAA